MRRLLNKLLKQKMDGSYTVEATAIFGITIGIIFLMIAFGFRIYHICTEEILAYEVRIENPAEIFRMISFGKDVLEEVFQK